MIAANGALKITAHAPYTWNDGRVQTSRTIRQPRASLISGRASAPVQKQRERARSRRRGEPDEPEVVDRSRRREERVGRGRRRAGVRSPPPSRRCSCRTRCWGRGRPPSRAPDSRRRTPYGTISAGRKIPISATGITSNAVREAREIAAEARAGASRPRRAERLRHATGVDQRKSPDAAGISEGEHCFFVDRS